MAFVIKTSNNELYKIILPDNSKLESGDIIDHNGSLADTESDVGFTLKRLGQTLPSIDVTGVEDTIGEGNNIEAVINVYAGLYELSKLDYYIDETLVGSVNNPSEGLHNFTFLTSEYPVGSTFTIKAVVMDISGETAEFSKSVEVVELNVLRYFGIWNDEDESDPFYVPLSTDEEKSANATYKWEYSETEYSRPVYKYPKQYGNLTSIKDASAPWEYLESFTLTNEIISGIEYNVYTKTESIDSGNVTFIFSI